MMNLKINLPVLRKKRTYGFLLTLAVFLYACSKTCYCSVATLYPSYVAFSPSETDTVVLRRYAKGTGFSTLLDTAILTAKNTVFRVNNDTLSIGADTGTVRLVSYFDYILYLPSLQRTDSISGIYETRDTEKGSHSLSCNCTNRILSFYRNRDTLKAPDPASPHVYIYR
jgi:hypothetical protein